METKAIISTHSPKSPKTKPRPIQYSDDLFHAIPNVCTKAKAGAEMCRMIGTFFQDYAMVEDSYAKNLKKISKGAAVDDWIQPCNNKWTGLLNGLTRSGKVQLEYATKLAQVFASDMKKFADQQDLQIHNLVNACDAEKRRYEQAKVSHQKVKKNYEKKTQEAIETIAAWKNGIAEMELTDLKSPSNNASSTNSQTTTSQLFFKVWDTTTSLGKPSVEKLRQRLDSALDSVLNAEQRYIVCVDKLNAQSIIYVQNMKENLHMFQLAEHQRISYLKQFFERFEDSVTKTAEKQSETVAEMSKFCEAFENPEGTVTQYLPEESLKLGAKEADGPENISEKQQVIAQASGILQSIAEKTQSTLASISNVLVLLHDEELDYTAGLMKLLQAHDPAEQFARLLLSLGQLCGTEGKSLQQGWKGVIAQIQRICGAHTDYAGLLHQPVFLNIDNVKQHHDQMRKQMMLKLNEACIRFNTKDASLKKSQQRLEAKAREEQLASATLDQARKDSASSNKMIGSPRGGTSMSSSATAAAANVVFGNIMGSSVANSMKLSKLEAKVEQIKLDHAKYEQEYDEHLVEQQDAFVAYREVVQSATAEWIIVETTRLEVALSSLASWTKARKAVFEAIKRSSKICRSLIDSICPTSDIQEFVSRARAPYKDIPRVGMLKNGNQLLILALEHRQQQRAPASTSNNPLTPLESEASRLSLRDTLLPKTKDSPARKGVNPLRMHSLMDFTDDEDDSLEAEIFSDGDEDLSDKQIKAPTAGLSDEVQKDIDSASALQNADLSSIQSPVSTKPEALASPEPDSSPKVDAEDSDDFRRKFKLPQEENCVSNFSCTYCESSAFPDQGRLYFSQNYACFSGFRQTNLIIPIKTIVSVKKKFSVRVVPNALEITTSNDEKYFFANFVYRDQAYQDVCQLKEIIKGTERMLGIVSEASEESSSTQDTVDVSLIPEKQIPPDKISQEYQSIIDEYFYMSVADIFNKFWEDSKAYNAFLCSLGETNISITDWSAFSKCPDQANSYQAVSIADTFEKCRMVSFDHNKKYIVGPSCVPTKQIQRYRYDLPKNRDTAAEEKFVLSITSTIAGVMYHDYFRVEQRWVFTQDPKVRHRSHMYAGTKVVFLKNTWIKSKIESSSIEETQKSMQKWLKFAAQQIEHPKVQPLSSTEAPGTNLLPKEPKQKEELDQTDQEHRELGAFKEAPSSFTQTLVNTNKMTIFIGLVFLLTLLYTIYSINQLHQAVAQHRLVQEEVLQQLKQQQDMLQRLMSPQASVCST